MLATLFAACRPGDPPPTAPPAAAASCALAPDNALRAVCTVTLPAADVVEVDLSDGTRAARFTDAAVATEHVIPLWGMTPETTWSYEVRGAGRAWAGTFETGALPAEVALTLTPEDTASPTEVRMVLAPLACGAEAWAVVFDFDGRVWWYQDVQRAGEGEALVSAMTWGDDDQVLALVGSHQITSYDLSGRNTLWTLAPHVVHHDVARRDGVTYALMADEYVEDDGRRYVEDLVGGFDAAGEQVYLFETHDHMGIDPPPGDPSPFWDSVFPGAIDAWHANGLYVGAAGDVYVSMWRMENVLKLVDGEIAWNLMGDGEDRYLATDFRLVAGDGEDATFKNQHHPSVLANGHLTVFDNWAPRGLELALDEAAGTATFVGEWPIDGPCPYESSFYPLDGGHRLLTCSTTHEFWELDAAAAVVRKVPARCAQGRLPFQTPRGVPVDLWEAHVGTVRASRLGAGR